MKKANGPPRFAIWLLTRRLSSEWRDFVVGDLEEEFAKRCDDLEFAARVWLWWQTLRCLVAPVRPRPSPMGSSQRDSMVRTSFAGLRIMSRWITLSEIRLGLRLIAKQPVLSLTIVLALAIGIGLATIGFTLREAMLQGRLPFANGDRFVRLVLHSEAEDNVELYLDAYHAIRDTSKSFVHLGAVGDGEYALEGEDGSVEAIRVNLVTPRSFQFLPPCR